MILADTSIWIDHFRGHNELLFKLLDDEKILAHPLVIGELAMGSLTNRRQVLRDLADLPVVGIATHAEVIAFVEWRQLHNLGLGFIDAHLLASACITKGASLWSRDKRLAAQAERLGIAYAT